MSPDHADRPRGRQEREPGGRRCRFQPPGRQGHLKALALLAAAALSVTGAGSGWAAQCAVPELEMYKSLIRPLDAGARAARTHVGDHPMAPPADPNVGDSWLWYVWHLNGPPWAEQKMCTVRGEGEHVYVVVEDSQWGTRVNQEDIDAIIEAWDNSSVGPWPDKGIYELNTENFGPVPDELDNDPKVYVLYYDFDVSSDGFFWYFDQYPDGTQPYESNECEVLYMNCSDRDPGGEYLISVQAHEFHHLIHWLADDNEVTWLNEGLAEMAMWLYGHPDPVVSFPSQPDINLTTWQNGFADYVKVYLFSLYLYEHFGGQEMMLNLTAQQLNSTASVQQALTDLGYPTTFAELLRDWVTANYLDDPVLEGGRYNYAGEDIPAFAAVTKNSYPVPPQNATVNHFAADYVRFINGEPQVLNFDGTDNSQWAARVIRFQAGTPLSVEDIPLDGTDMGAAFLVGFGTEFDEAVLVAANTISSGGTSYTYSTGTLPTAVGDPAGDRAPRLALASPNPFRGETSLRWEGEMAGPWVVTVHDAGGRLVRELGAVGPGSPEIRWDGQDGLGRPVEDGVYFVRAVGHAGQALEQRVVRLR